MLTISETKDYELVKEVITSPKIFAFTYGQSLQVQNFEVDKTYRYLVIKKEEETVAILPIREVTKKLLETHIYMNTDYLGSDIYKNIKEVGHEWALNQGYLVITSSCPSNAIHSIKFFNKLNYIPCGLIKNAVIYNGHLVSLILFNYDLLTGK